MSSPSLTFLGAAGTVTGSKFLLRAGGRALLLDAGVFQGEDELEQRDWRPFPVPPAGLDAVVLTHAHIDHTGYLPRLVADGFEGPAFATPGTLALLHLLLPDSAHLQEEQARYANKRAYARRLPAKPLYTMEDADRALRLLRPMPFGGATRVADGVEVTPRPAGHLLGSATLQIDINSGARLTRLVLSGDLGRYGQDVMADPAPVPRADVLLLESTYGDRAHDDASPRDALREAILRVHESDGVLLVPSFAVGRAQHVLYHVRRLQDEVSIPRIPVYVDSPMAVDATDTYCAHGDDPNLRVRLSMDPRDDCPLHCRDARFVRSADESKRLNERRGPMLVISANGMCTGGRILHHLKRRLPDERNVVLFVGYQGRGTRGRRLMDGAKETRIHGEDVPVNARILRLDGLSGHADRGELLRWLRGFEAPPRRTLLVHGEPDALHALRGRVARDLGWDVDVARLDETVRLGEA